MSFRQRSWGRLRALAELSWIDLPLVARAWVRLWRIARLLDLDVPLPEIRRRLAPRAPRRRRVDRSARRWRLVVALAARLHPRRPACLERSICLESLLERAGLPADLCIGVRRDGPALAAHAWVEAAGPSAAPASVERRLFAVLLPRLHESVR